MTNHQSQDFWKTLLVGLTCVAVLFFTSGTGRALEQEEEAGERSGTKVEVNIKEKRMDAVLSSSQGFRLAEDIEILDTKGRIIDIVRLMVPCRAEIEYHSLEGGAAVAIRIRALKLLPGATTRFPPPVPE